MNRKRELIVAVDGPSGSGKSTIARMLARALGYTYIDTGAMYRAVALAAGEQGIDPGDDQGLAELCRDIDLEFRRTGDEAHVVLNGRDVEDEIRKPEISMLASAVSARPSVRRAMVDRQRRMGAHGGIVMEGRDIGTNVFPNADVKIYLTASEQVRGCRRNEELRAKGLAEDLDATMDNMRKRDADDSSRELAPLIKARDAIELDTSDKTIEQVLQRAAEIVNQARKK